MLEVIESGLIDTWMDMYVQVDGYMTEHKKRPVGKGIGGWLRRQLSLLKKSRLNSIKRDKMREMIDKHKELFMSNEEIWQV